MMIWLLLAFVIYRPYQHVTVDSIASTRYRHVQIVGTVTLVRHEHDGDWHIRIEDEHGHFVVCEIVNYHPLPRPRMGTSILARGIRGYDDEGAHGWWELNPVESWEYVK